MNIEEKLNQPLDPSLIKTREQGGKTFSYIEGARAYEQANKIFGYDGWSRETLNIEQVAQYTQDSRYGGEQYVVVYTAKVRVHALGVYRDGVGAAVAYSSNLADAIELAIKSAETDATKRALATFGPQFGLHLYFGDDETAPPQHSEPASQQNTSTGGNKPTIKDPGGQASEKQVNYIYSLMAGVKIPKEHREPLLKYLTAGEPLTKGEASNIIDLFKSGEYKDIWEAYMQDARADEVF